MSSAESHSVWVGATLVLIGALAFAATFRISPGMDGGLGPRLFPLLASGGLIVLGAVESYRARPWRASVRWARLPGLELALLALCAAYVSAITSLGYILATGFVAPAAMWLFGVRNPVVLVVATVVCPLAYYWLFFKVLGVYPPRGEWFDLLDVIQG